MMVDLEHLGVGRTALVIDDEPAILAVLEGILSDAGFATTCLDRGAPALRMLEAQPVDLLVVDVGLPDINGLQICQEARSRYGNDIAILVVTADARTERCILALELGADDFVGKPFDVNELLERINVKLRVSTR